MSAYANPSTMDIENESDQQDAVFKKVLLVLALVYLVFGVAVPFMEQVEIPRQVKERLPPQLAKIIIEKRQLELPKKKPIEPEKLKPKDEPKEPPKKQEKPKEIKKPEAIKPKVQTMTRQQAREKAQTVGLAAMKDELFAMREIIEVKPSKALLKTQENKPKKQGLDRSLLTAKANTQSKQFAAANNATLAKSAALAERDSQHIRLAEEEVVAAPYQASNEVQAESAEEKAGQRTEQSIRRVLEANKSSLYTLYNRALRKNPLLKGKVEFQIEILPNGKISKASIISSALNDAKLERRLLLRLKSIRFAAEKVDVISTIWALEFLPG